MEIAVCGCGPAGLAAALLLRRAGHRVTVFERFATPRPVGSGLILQPTGLAVLLELGVLPRILALGAPIERLFGRAVPSNWIVLDVRYRTLGAGWRALGVHRAALFETLHGAAVASDVKVVYSAPITGLDRSGRRAVLNSSSGSLGEFDLVVDALGANSPLAAGSCARTVLPFGALWANIPWPDNGPTPPDALEQRYDKARRMSGLLPIGRHTEAGLRLGAFFWSLRRDRFEQWRTRGIESWKQEVQQLWPAVVPVIESIREVEQLTFAQYDHFTMPVPYSQQLVHIGDAARSTSPQLGQGANMALLDALALAHALQNSASLPQALASYARLRFWHVRLFQWASATFTPFYQSDSRILPLLRDWLAAPLSRLPIGDQVLARLVSGMTVPALARCGFKPLRLR